MIEPRWPVAEFDPVRALRVVAATTPGAALHEGVLDAPFDAVWAVAADLETELPHWLFPDIRTVRLSHPEAAGSARSVARIVGYSGLRARFDVVLRPGWCLMQSRFLIGGMAAVAEDGATRFAFLGGFRGPLRFLGPATRPLSGPSGRRAFARFARRVDLRETERDR